MFAVNSVCLCKWNGSDAGEIKKEWRSLAWSWEFVVRGGDKMPKVLENPKQNILLTARDMLVEHGYYEFNIRDVAKATGVAVGTIYNYFPTKGDLVSEIVIEYGENCLRDIAEIGQSSGDFYEKLGKMFEEIQLFIDTFRGIWYKMSEEVQFGRSNSKKEKHQEFMVKLINLVVQMVQEETMKEPAAQIPVEPGVFARFLVQNFLVMGQMKTMDYATFEPILRKLLD